MPQPQFDDPEMEAACRAAVHGDYDTYCRYFAAKDLARGVIRTAPDYGGRGIPRVAENYTPPNPYEIAIAKQRGSATPESRFEEQRKAARMREIDEQHDRWTAQWAAEPPRPSLTPAERTRYTPPRPYDLAIARLKEQR